MIADSIFFLCAAFLAPAFLIGSGLHAIAAAIREHTESKR